MQEPSRTYCQIPHTYSEKPQPRAAGPAGTLGEHWPSVVLQMRKLEPDTERALPRAAGKSESQARPELRFLSSSPAPFASDHQREISRTKERSPQTPLPRNLFG